jgi:hypothetical protein
MRDQLTRIFNQRASNESVDVNLKPDIEDIKELVYFAREEMMVCLDLVQRLITSTSIREIEKCEDPHIRTVPTSKSQNEADAVDSLIGVKQRDLQLFCTSLETAYTRLLNEIETENYFFSQLAFNLRSLGWIIQEKSVGPNRRVLFVNYGYNYGILLAN